MTECLDHVHDSIDDLQQGNAIILSSRVLSTRLDLTHDSLSAPSHPVFSHFVKTVVLDGIFGMNKLWMSTLILTSNLLYWYQMNELYNLETSTFASSLLQGTCVWSYTESVSPISSLSLHPDCCCCWKTCCCCWKASCCCCVSAICKTGSTSQRALSWLNCVVLELPLDPPKYVTRLHANWKTP